MTSQEVQASQIIKSDYNKSKIRLEWIVPKSLLEYGTEDRKISSPSFKVNINGSTYNWVVGVYPKGKKKYSSYVCLYVYISMELLSSAWKDTTLIQYDASIKCEDGTLECVDALSEFPISQWDSTGQGFPFFCDQDSFEEFYVNDTMTFVIDATISIEKQDCVRDQNISPVKYEKEGKEKLSASFAKMYELVSFSDIVIFCGDQKFLCHKLVLASRSSVLKDILENEQGGKIGGELEITDASPDIFKDIIDHIYTGVIPVDEKLGSELFKQAVKYNLEDLIKACEVSLLSNLTSGNSLSTLITIDTHRSSTTIRKDVIKFIALNVLNIMGNENWESFARDYPHMMTEIMRCLANRTTAEVLPTIQRKSAP